MKERDLIPGAITLGIAEAAATGIAVKSSLEGNPLTVKELLPVFAFATFYVGIPSAILVNVIKLIWDGCHDQHN